MWLSYGLSGRVIQTWVILWVVQAGYPDGGYPVGCPGRLSGCGLSGGLSGLTICILCFHVDRVFVCSRLLLGCLGSFDRSGRDMCCQWVIRCLIHRLFGANLYYIYACFIDNT